MFIRISKAGPWVGGVCRQTVYQMIRDGRLPAPVTMGSGIVGWEKEVLDAWIKSRPAVSWAPKAA